MGGAQPEGGDAGYWSTCASSAHHRRSVASVHLLITHGAIILVMAAPRVLFLCTHNSARSQMAEALLRARSRGRVAVESAGTEQTFVR
ncbi:MAG: hypothetical protein ACKOC3_02925, partial [Candidatus Limnocylindrus sp.]